MEIICQNEQVDKIIYFGDIMPLNIMGLIHKKWFVESFKVKKKIVTYQVIIVTYILLGIFLFFREETYQNDFYWKCYPLFSLGIKFYY